MGVYTTAIMYQNFCQRARQKKEQIIRPLVIHLNLIHATHVTIARMLIGISGIVILPFNQGIFLLTTALFIFGDVLDGSLARYQKRFGPYWLDKTADLTFYAVLLLQLFLISKNFLFIFALFLFFVGVIIRFRMIDTNFVDLKYLVIFAAFFQAYTLGAIICMFESLFTFILCIIMSKN